MKHPTAIDAFEVELRKAKAYLDANSDRPDRWRCVQMLRRVLKTGFATIRDIEGMKEPDGALRDALRLIDDLTEERDASRRVAQAQHESLERLKARVDHADASLRVRQEEQYERQKVARVDVKW